MKRVKTDNIGKRGRERVKYITLDLKYVIRGEYYEKVLWKTGDKSRICDFSIIHFDHLIISIRIIRDDYGC